MVLSCPNRIRFECVVPRQPERIEHGYGRLGTTCLFGNLNVATGEIVAPMLSYLLVKELRECWRELDSTVEENISALSGLSGVRLRTKDGGEIYMIPEPRRDLAKFFSLADVVPPTLLPAGRTNADTERKLTSRRK